jgi:hypothetical protein
MFTYIYSLEHVSYEYIFDGFTIQELVVTWLFSFTT